MILQHLTLTCPFNVPLLQAMLVSAALSSALLFQPSSQVQAESMSHLTAATRAVSIRAMYSAPFSRLPSRAANFLLLGYTNYSISILYWAVAGSWDSTRHRWPVQAIVITTPQRPSVRFVRVSQTHAASVLTAFILLFSISYPDLSVSPISYFPL